MSRIVEVAVADGRFNTLVAAVEAANLAETLNERGPFTLFAPTDDAFAGLPEGTIEGLLNDLPGLSKLLLYHVLPARLAVAELTQHETLQTAEGSTVKVRQRDSDVYINDAKIVQSNVEAENGLMHIVDTVLLPPQPYKS